MSSTCFIVHRGGGRDRDRGGYGDRDRDRGGRGGGGGGYGDRGGGRPSLKGSQPGGNLRKPKWDMSRLSKFEKNFYKEHPLVTQRPQVCIVDLYGNIRTNKM